MSCWLRRWFFVALTLAGMFAIVPRAGAEPQAEYEELRDLAANQMPPGVERDSDAHFDWVRAKARTLRERGLQFQSTYPTNPLRWDVVVLMQYSGYLELIVRADGSRAAVAPAAEGARWRRQYLEMLEDLLESTDAGPAAREAALIQLIDHYCSEIRQGTVDNPRRGLVPALKDWVNEVYALDPKSGRLAYLYIRVARILNALDPAVCQIFLEEKLARHPRKGEPDENVRRNVVNFQRLVRNQVYPATELWEYLQRVDPAFDAAAYRGKVVLIANLAVDWTLRTMELEDLYAKYHDAGLEIIQLVSENRSQTFIRVANERRAEPQAPLVQRDEAAMRRFVAEKKWPWPVLWDTAIYPNKFGSFWSLNSVPAYILVGRDGRIAREIPGQLKWDVRIPKELMAPASQ